MQCHTAGSVCEVGAGEMLRLQMHHNASLADQGMGAHLAAVGDLVTAATDTVSDKAAEGTQECAQGVCIPPAS